jgi:glycosyltransferase involved in cell wall biosynthesis
VNPDLIAQVPTAEFLPYVALPIHLPEARPKPRRAIPRIVHAPSNRSIKGTEFLLAASEALQAAHPHELQLLDRLPRDRALEVYAQADILVDQLRLGWYGAVAVEAMARGVPVVAYLNEEDLARIPRSMREEMPIVNASPETLPSALARLLKDAGLREDLGRQGQQFVRRWHHPLKIARRLLQLYDDPSQSFWAAYDPNSTS